MTTTEQRRTIEARLDRLKERANLIPHAHNMESAQRITIGVLKGVIDLLSDVLLEDEPRPTTSMAHADWRGGR